MKTRKKKVTRVVPALVLSASFVAVIPACGGATTSNDAGSDAASDVLYGVAAVAYCCFDSGVADIAFIPDADADAATDAPADVQGGG